MSTPSERRRTYLDLVRTAWAPYPATFAQLEPPVQGAWLASQGYARLADVLGHVIAWWEVAYDRIERLAAGKAAPMIQYDVDAFNRDAVLSFAAHDEAEVIRQYAAWCTRWEWLLEQLRDEAFEHPDILRQLQMDLSEHLNDHALPAG